MTAQLSRTQRRMLSVLSETQPMSKFEIVAAMRRQKWADSIFQITSALKALTNCGALQDSWQPATIENNWQTQQVFVRAADTGKIDPVDIAPSFLEKLNHLISQIPPRDPDWRDFK